MNDVAAYSQPNVLKPFSDKASLARLARVCVIPLCDNKTVLNCKNQLKTSAACAGVEVINSL